MIHVINGRVVTTPQEGETFLRETKSMIQLVITRAGARPRARDGSVEAAADASESAKADRRRSVISLVAPGSGRRAAKSRDANAVDTGGASTPLACAPGTEPARATAAARATTPAGASAPEAHTTVVVSCSQLIVESKRIVGPAAGVDSDLDELCACALLTTRTAASVDPCGRCLCTRWPCLARRRRRACNVSHDVAVCSVSTGPQIVR